MMRALSLPEGAPPLAVATHLAQRIYQFQRPSGLLAYWRQPTNRRRLRQLPAAWAWELERRAHEWLETMNALGPY